MSDHRITRQRANNDSELKKAVDAFDPFASRNKLLFSPAKLENHPRSLMVNENTDNLNEDKNIDLQISR